MDTPSGILSPVARPVNSAHRAPLLPPVNLTSPPAAPIQQGSEASQFGLSDEGFDDIFAADWGNVPLSDDAKTDERRRAN